jgi:hypothetical protein
MAERVISSRALSPARAGLVHVLCLFSAFRSRSTLGFMLAAR